MAVTDPEARPPDVQEAWLVLAHLLRPQGRKGELLADLLTDFPERFGSREGISLRRPNGSLEPATVEDHWLPVGRNAGRIVLKLQGVDSIEAAERLASCDLVVPPAQRTDLDSDAEYIADLLGCTLFDRDLPVGIVADLHFPTSATGTRLPDAPPLLVIHSPGDGEEILIPFVKAWIETVNIPARRIAMHLPEGLLSINT